MGCGFSKSKEDIVPNEPVSAEQTHEEQQLTAAISIQSFWRGYQAKKKFGVHQLAKTEMTNYKTYLVGNDPKITGIESYASSPGEKVALIGTSGLRSLALACKVGNREVPPKLIIVDNSRNVIDFWRGLRAMVEREAYDTSVKFLDEFDTFLQENKNLYYLFDYEAATRRMNSRQFEYENQDPLFFLKNVIDTFGIQYVCMIIKNTTVIGQSWTDNTLFSPIKNILRLNGIEKTYLYPSNIAHCISYDEIDSFCANIQTMSPALSIITDLCPVHMMPENVLLTTETNAEELRKLTTLPPVFVQITPFY